MLGLLLLGLIGLAAGLADSDSSDSYDYDDSCSRSDTYERFEDRWPYEYDKLTGYSRCDYRNDGNWTDCVGNQYEQIVDAWGNIRYEKIDDEDD